MSDSTQIVPNTTGTSVAPLPTRPGTILLADCSSSMNHVDDRNSGARRIDRLVEVMAHLLTYTRLQGLVAFNHAPTEIPLVGNVLLPLPQGTTALDLAIDLVRRMPVKPNRLLVLSDGEPDNEERALHSARELVKSNPTLIIDAYYIGPDSRSAALNFMAALSACGAPGGQSGHFSLTDTKKIGQELVLRLTHRKQEKQEGDIIL